MQILVIDGNNWFRREAETSLLGNPMRSCFNMIQNSIADRVYLCWDGFNSRKIRKEIYPEYKARRTAPGEDFFTIQKTFKQVAEFSRAIIIEVPEYEADDVVAQLVTDLKKDPSVTRIKIHSNDADFAQLGVELARDEFKIPPRWVRLYKATVGDTSDNIKGIAGFGQGAWDGLTDHHRVALESFLIGTTDETGGFLHALSKGAQKAFATPEGVTHQRNLYKIVGFFDVPRDLIAKHTTSGFNRPDLADGILKELFC